MTEAKKERRPLSAITLLSIVLLIVAIATWFVPTSAVVENEDGTAEIVYNARLDNDGNLVENAGTDPAGLWDILLAPVAGFSDGAAVSMSILISGGLLAILAAVGAMDAGLGALLRRFSGPALIALLMLFFALTGTVYGSCEELPAYAMVIIPLCVAAGYDVMTAFLLIFVGATVGNMASVTNPYSVGAAVAFIGNENLSLGTGIGMRLVLFVVTYAMGTFFVLRYAARVKADPSSSVIANVPDINTLSDRDDANLDAFPEMTPRRKWSLVVFALVIVVLVIGYIPWDSIGDGSPFDVVNGPFTWLTEHAPVVGDLLGTRHYMPFGWWYFDEFGVVFLLGAIVIGLVNRMPVEEWVDTFVKGAGELVSLTVVIAISRGVSLIMGSRTSGMSVTFVYWIRNFASNVPVWAFAVAMVVAYVLIGFVMQSTSATAGITMPILGAVALALFADSAIGGEAGQMVLVSAYTVGLNFTAMGIYPDAPKMGVLDMTHISYGIFLKEAIKIYVPILIVATAIIMGAPYLGLAG